MSTFKKSVMWIYMLNKRLYKRPSFIAMLLIIGALTAALNIFAAKDNYILRIGIYAKEESTVEFLEEATSAKSVIGYIFYNSEKEAQAAVKTKVIDAAWIFDENIETAANRFVKQGKVMVKVFQNADTVFLRIAREKLYTLMYPYISRAVYDNFMHNTFGENNTDILNKYYNSELANDDIVEIKFNNSNEQVENLNYITGPVRGLLAVTVFLCGYSALISFKKDKENRLFARFSANKLIYIEAASMLVVMLNAAAITLIALKLSGLFSAFGLEVIYMTAYVVMSIAFLILLGELFNNINAMSAVLPVLAMLLIVICPVFINVTRLDFLQKILPTYYYLSAFRSSSFIAKGLTVSVFELVLAFFVRYLKK